MIGVYATHADGYMSLAPVTDLGRDLPVALWKSGVRGGDYLPRATGMALLVMHGTSATPVLLGRVTEQFARVEAMKLVSHGPVTVLQAAYSGQRIVYRRKEVLEVMTRERAQKEFDAHYVTPLGVLVNKVLGPADPDDAKVIEERLSSQLMYEERQLLGTKLRDYLRKKNVDWGALSANKLSRELSKVRSDLKSILGTASAKLMPTWQEKVRVSITGVVNGAKQTLRSNFFPQIGISLSQPDRQAINQIARQQGFWMRDSAGVRSDQLTRAGRAVIRDGLKQGLGRNEIARQLEAKIPQAWQKYGRNYFRTVASVSVNRARSYSEVSGYLEAGIESLEIQAVLDERTTDICRCLDGQIISTELASQQVFGAMNVKQPEDIVDASPFLRTVTDKETGIRSIVTENNGTKVADIVRSGAGKVDDNGQFRRYIAGNALTDHNIGPPPYHHLCRSWTVPVTTTVQVPRNEIPQAQGTTSPVPPKPMPKGTPRPAGVGQRPQSGVKEPQQTKPVPYGKPDVIERYPYTEDFLYPPPLPPSFMVGNKLKEAAVYQRYRYTPLTRAIGPTGQPEVVKALDEALGKTTLSSLRKEMDLAANISGVSMHVSVVDTAAVKDIILAEAKQFPGRRVYSLRESTSGKVGYLKFNGDKRSAAKAELSKLRKATTDADIQASIRSLEKKGYVSRYSNAEDFNFGDPAPNQSPVPLTTPIPKPRVKPKPKTPLDPTVRTKPSRTETAVSTGGQLAQPTKPPKPKAPSSDLKHPSEGSWAKDYSEYGLLNTSTHSLREQVVTRSQLETARISDALKAADERLTGVLSVVRRGNVKSRTIREFFISETGVVEKITGRTIVKYTTPLVATQREELIAAVVKAIDDGRLSGVAKGLTLRQASQSASARLTSMAMETHAQRIFDYAKRYGLPPLYLANNLKKGSLYDPDLNAIVIPAGLKGSALDRYFRHEFAHFVDQLGKGSNAAVIWKNLNATSGIKKGPTFDYVEGKWADKRIGTVYQGDYASEVSSYSSESLTEGRERFRLKMYDVNPEILGFYLALSKGSFIR